MEQASIPVPITWPLDADAPEVMILVMPPVPSQCATRSRLLSWIIPPGKTFSGDTPLFGASVGRKLLEL